MRNDLSGGIFDARLKAAQAEGMMGRKELLDKLARMPIEKVAGLPPSSLAILGPQGLARLAAIREELAGADRKTATEPKPTRNAPTVKPTPPRAAGAGGFPSCQIAYRPTALAAAARRSHAR